MSSLACMSSLVIRTFTAITAKHWQKPLFAAALVCWTSVVCWHMWVADDAYITFRVIDNFMHGHGLRWNIGERVQAYSNPLWLLIHLSFYAVWPHIVYVTLLISLGCTILSTILVLSTFRRSPAVMAVVFLLALSLSRTLALYSSSGLENPLTTLLFAWFGWELIRHHTSPRWFWLALIVALSMVNRLDSCIVYVPVLLWLVWSHRAALGRSQFLHILAGVLPLLCWLAFSLFYYGFLLPNTKYAKLDTGVSALQYIKLGLNYTLEFALSDPVMAVVMLGVSCLVLSKLLRFRKYSSLPTEHITVHMVALGMIAYSAYIIVVGGSYVSGRFSSLPAFMGVWLLLAILPPEITIRKLLAGLLVMLALYSLNDIPAWRNWKIRTMVSGKMFGTSSGKFVFIEGPKELNQPRQAWCVPEDPVVVKRILGAGLNPYYEQSPCTHFVDVWVLADALLARLPSGFPLTRVGHAQRRVPAGYIHALKTGSLKKMPRNLARYYKPLRFIITGDLWNTKRLKTILRFNLGAYEHRRKKYLKNRAKKTK